MRTFKQSDFTFYKTKASGGSVSNGIRNTNSGVENLQANKTSKPTGGTSRPNPVGNNIPDPRKPKGYITAACLAIVAIIIIGGVIYITSEPKEKNNNQKKDKT